MILPNKELLVQSSQLKYKIKVRKLLIIKNEDARTMPMTSL